MPKYTYIIEHDDKDSFDYEISNIIRKDDAIAAIKEMQYWLRCKFKYEDFESEEAFNAIEEAYTKINNLMIEFNLTEV